MIITDGKRISSNYSRYELKRFAKKLGMDYRFIQTDQVSGVVYLFHSASDPNIPQIKPSEFDSEALNAFEGTTTTQKKSPLKTSLKGLKRKATGEKQFFRSLEKKNLCECCGKKIVVHVPQTYAHIISKKKRPDLRLSPSNIFQSCFDTPERKSCHTIYDQGTWKERIERMEHFLKERIMPYIFDNDLRLYWTWRHKIEDVEPGFFG